MRLLIIGIDGGHADAYRRGWTPFLEKLIDNGNHLEIREDLISRGWSNIIFGLDGSKTGAVYDRPELNGTHSWSLRFSLDDIPGYGHTIKPLWQRLNEHGFKVGVMNVPTAFPAPEVDGFFVSGGGGGGSVLHDPTADLCHPKDILKGLLESGYIVDERLVTMLAEKRIYEPRAFFSRLSLKNEKRTDSFIQLADEFGIDFGFVVYRSSSVLAESLILPELEAAKQNNKLPDHDLVAAAEAYYRHFDQQINRLFTRYPKTEILLVSDHGTVVRRGSFNPNSLLVDLGYQVELKRKRFLYKIVRFITKKTPYSLRLAIRNKPIIKKQYESLITFDNSRTKAFATVIGTWKHGVYINDCDRFGGPVSANDIDLLKNEIVEAVNAHALANKYRIKAYTKPKHIEGNAPQFPDIVLKVPDGLISSSDYKDIVQVFNLPSSPLGLKSVTQGRLLYGKSSRALAVNTKSKWKINQTNKQYDDLTAVYNHVISIFTEKLG